MEQITVTREQLINAFDRWNYEFHLEPETFSSNLESDAQADYLIELLKNIQK